VLLVFREQRRLLVLQQELVLLLSEGFQLAAVIFKLTLRQHLGAVHTRCLLASVLMMVLLMLVC
jgi:hypothetical protein